MAPATWFVFQLEKHAVYTHATISQDGLKAYVASGQTLSEYNLLTPYDMSSAKHVFTRTMSLGSNIAGIEVNADGTFLLVGTNTSYVYQVNLSVPYSLANVEVFGSTSTKFRVHFSASGLTRFLLGSSSEEAQIGTAFGLFASPTSSRSITIPNLSVGYGSAMANDVSAIYRTRLSSGLIRLAQVNIVAGTDQPVTHEIAIPEKAGENSSVCLDRSGPKPSFIFLSGQRFNLAAPGDLSTAYTVPVDTGMLFGKGVVNRSGTAALIVYGDIWYSYSLGQATNGCLEISQRVQHTSLSATIFPTIQVSDNGAKCFVIANSVFQQYNLPIPWSFAGGTLDSSTIPQV
jgi:hypothetical protein